MTPTGLAALRCPVLASAAGVLAVSASVSGCGSDRAAETGRSPITVAGDAVAADGCAQSRTPGEVTGTGPGSESDGPDAILAFEHAYYAERSADAALRVVAVDAVTGRAREPLTAAVVQRGIDHVPAGTRYCVRITPVVTGGTAQGRWRYAVAVTQQLPGQPAAVTGQMITTARDEQGRARITAITPA